MPAHWTDRPRVGWVVLLIVAGIGSAWELRWQIAQLEKGQTERVRATDRAEAVHDRDVAVLRDDIRELRRQINGCK